jgi:hypothetical protein
MSLKSLPLIFLCLLASCAPGTVNSIKQSPFGTIEFETDQGYQAVYRKAVAHIRNNHRSFLYGQLKLNSDIYTDIEQGVITIEAHDILHRSIFLHSTILSEKPNKSKISIYYGTDWWGDNAASLKAAILKIDM